MKKRLLIVEDVELNRDLLVQLFEELYEIELAEDGETAVLAAEATRPDVILMDIALPRMSGLEATRAIRRSSHDSLHDVPIVAVSSGVMPGDRQRALDAGCDDFVAKPIDDLQLVELVRGLMGEP
jgi:two-component system, cell cycle response regulator DivK